MYKREVNIRSICACKFWWLLLFLNIYFYFFKLKIKFNFFVI